MPVFAKWLERGVVAANPARPTTQFKRVFNVDKCTLLDYHALYVSLRYLSFGNPVDGFDRNSIPKNVRLEPCASDPRTRVL